MKLLTFSNGGTLRLSDHINSISSIPVQDVIDYLNAEIVEIPNFEKGSEIRWGATYGIFNSFHQTQHHKGYITIGIDGINQVKAVNLCELELIE